MIAASTATRTTSAAESPSAVTRGIPANSSEQSAITTVPPAKTTALPEVATERAIASLALDALVEALEVALDDEQRVVDSDAEADHRSERRRDRRDLGQVAEQADQRQSPVITVTSAVAIGSDIATTVPNVNSRMITAIARPIASLDSVAGFETCWPR